MTPPASIPNTPTFKYQYLHSIHAADAAQTLFQKSLTHTHFETTLSPEDRLVIFPSPSANPVDFQILPISVALITIDFKEQSAFSSMASINGASALRPTTGPTDTPRVTDGRYGIRIRTIVTALTDHNFRLSELHLLRSELDERMLVMAKEPHNEMLKEEHQTEGMGRVQRMGRLRK